MFDIFFFGYSTFLFAFLLPAVQITLMCGVIGGDPKGLRFGVVNHEIEDPYDCDFTEGCDLANISCRYLYGLAEDSTFELYPFQSEDRAHHAAQQGEVWGVMTFGPNFTQALVTAAIEGRDASEEILNMSTIRVIEPFTIYSQETRERFHHFRLFAGEY